MSSRFGSDGAQQPAKENDAGASMAVEQGKRDVEALQVRLEEPGEPRITEQEMEAMVAEAPSPELRTPQPKSRWLNGKLVMPENT